MSLLDVVDAVVAAVPIATGVVRDDTGSSPSPFEPDRLYGWPVSETREPDGDGSLDLARFRLRLAYTVSASEGPDLPRDRAVSVELDTRADAIATWVRSNRTNALWSDLRVDLIDFDSIRGELYRGVELDLSGYRDVP